MPKLTTSEDVIKKEISYWFHECQHWLQKYKNLKKSLDMNADAETIEQLKNEVQILTDLLEFRQSANSNKQID